ncbi:complex I intermediate-associated protein CIA30 [Pseudohyphozyma bogoriensis]|nr:complex I intermediate-associated protein CIA30 [Pseudohyphozyma bogoriensis]
MATPWKRFMGRSMEYAKEVAGDIARADPTGRPTAVIAMAKLTSPEGIHAFTKGSDEDLGGKSTVNLDLGPEGKGRFWGRLSTELHAGRRKEGIVERGGYAGIRTKLTSWFPVAQKQRTQSRTTMFGTRTWDTSEHDFLRLRVRSSGDGMRYFVNIQTDGPVRSDLFQHRLWLPAPENDDAPHRWQDVIIPFKDFTLTNSGDMSENQIEMLRSKVRTVGISVLGPKEGRYELGLESIDAVSLDAKGAVREDAELNEKDVVSPL